jgi:hypothetical protein
LLPFGAIPPAGAGAGLEAAGDCAEDVGGTPVALTVTTCVEVLVDVRVVVGAAVFWLV